MQAPGDLGPDLPDPTATPAGAPAAGGFAGKTVRGGMATAAGQGSKILLNAAGLMIMARLLMPEDFGLVAMVAPIVELTALFQDFGLSTATVQRRSITRAQSTNLFWFNVIASTLLGLAVAGLAPAIAAFYGDDRLVWLTVAFGALVICSGLTAQHLALLTRDMRFGRLAKLDVAALAIGLVVGIVAAWQGLGYWSLVLSMAGRAVALLVLVWAVADWSPGLPTRRSGVVSMLRFGRDLTLARFCTFLIENVDSVLVGRVWGGVALGLYDRAYSVLKLYKQVNGPVNTIAVSVLSRLQDKPDRYRHYYVKGLALVAGVSMPFILFLAANATDVVRLALGEKWLGAVPIFLALVPATFIGTIRPATYWIYASLGRTDRQLRWSLFVDVPLTIAAYFVGLPYGAFGVAVAFSLITIVLRFPAILYCLRDFRAFIRLGDVIEAIVPPAFASIAAGGAAIAIKATLGWALGPVLAIAFDAALYGLLYLAIYCTLPIGRANARTYAQVIGRAFAR